MIESKDVIQAYEETGIKPTGTGNVLSEDGACAVGVYYLWMNGESLPSKESIGVTNAKALEFFRDITSFSVFRFGWAFDRGFNDWQKTENRLISEKDREANDIGYETGQAVREWYDRKEENDVTLSQHVFTA